MKKGKEKNYVIGYFGKGQDAIYSRTAWAFPEHGTDRKYGGVEAMTYLQAKKHLKSLLSENCTVAIYKLVPVFKEIRSEKNPSKTNPCK